MVVGNESLPRKLQTTNFAILFQKPKERTQARELTTAAAHHVEANCRYKHSTFHQILHVRLNTLQ
jgi:hypothetical protein